MLHKFIWVDAFTDQKFKGNPCVVVLNADDLAAEQMLTIAREMNLSETAFIVSSSVADFGARYFTPAGEIPLAGHPTIATIRALIEAKKIPLDKAHIRVSLQLTAGVIGIDIFHRGEDDYEIVMAQKKPTFLRTYDRSQVANIFGLDETDLLPGCPVQTVSTGTPQLMVPVKGLDALRKASMEIGAYRNFQAVSDFSSPHLFCLEAMTPNALTFARHFGVPPEAAEDAFTGSATGGMAAYLWHYGLIEQPTFNAEQGHWMGRAGCATVEVIGDRNNIETVKVGGKAVIVMKGEIVGFFEGSETE